MAEKTLKTKLLIYGIPIGLAALTLASFLGSGVGAKIFGGHPQAILNVSAPRPELPAERPFESFQFLTNTMLCAWISIITILAIFITAARNMKLVPHGFQNFIEYCYEVFADFAEDTAGKEYGRKFFPVCVTIFLFVLMNAWWSLVPGYETIKYNGVPLFRNANTDINLPMMLAVFSFCYVEYWGIRVNGIHYFKKFINLGPIAHGVKELASGKIKAGLGGIAMGGVAMATGVLELVSELVRLLSFTFRLFGNMTAGVILTMVMIYLIPWVAPAIFYGLESFTGFVQAMIFGALTLCFLVIAISSHEEETH
ncbi:MAG: F0F1 ATP synthase subunit A [bacterium]|nr:F0F1 ATP synthase subunit A [bacterium]